MKYLAVYFEFYAIKYQIFEARVCTNFRGVVQLDV